ncbi:CBS domain-containing protein [Microseira wollei]|uniref:histidine kinase n=1 Tax=Microseira wollei NIES-4236 TaxID=2530354 RepID=A0AAV3XLT4_9CYAN|nr:CBS domain-containing protein [Microseira wollei]GET41125.1 CBS sensor signal transduction histidine kinase [Microseira wollei NIES-4236]
MSPNLSDNQTLIEQALERHPLMMPPGTPLSEAIATMSRTGASYTLITQQEKLLGILTERDVVRLAISDKPLEEMTVSEVMTQNLITCPRDRADNIFDLLTLLHSAQIRHLPITDADGKLLGVLTGESLRAVLKPTDLLQMGRVADIMTKTVTTATPETSVFDVAQLMATQRRSCVAICTQETRFLEGFLKPVGIITERDIVKFAAQNIDLAQTKAETVMTSPLLPVGSDATLWEANQKMQQHRIRRLVVVDQAGYLVGIVTQTNLLQALDPAQMYATVELLQQTIGEKTRTLQQMNEQMQQAEAQLRQVNENLEAQVQARTKELMAANAQLMQALQERTAAETEVRRLNAILEQRVEERTAQLQETNQKLLQEIRDRQLLNEHLEASKNRMRAVFAGMNDIILVLDRQRNIEAMPTNTSSAYPSEWDMISETMAQLFQHENGSIWWQQVERVLETQQTINFDYKLSVGEGEIWFTANISPLSSNWAIWVARDISDRKIAEIALRHKNEELAHTLQKLQLAQQELIQSEKMAVLGQLVAGVAHEINTPLGAIRSSVQNIVDFLTHNLEKLPQFFQNLSQERGEEFFALLRKSSQQSTLFSSKQRRQLKKALRQQLEDRAIENPDTVADTLVDMGIYDQIEPFLPLLQDRNILRTAYQISTLQTSAQTIVTAAERAAKVVFALKTYTHDNPGGEKVLANITEGIETVLILYSNQIKQSVEIVRNYEQNLPYILCYADELNQVWTNLIHNALQAMNYKGTLKIDIGQQDNQIRVSFTDNGIGIPEEIMPKIFQPFFTTKPAGVGSGLGLDIVKKIVEKHGGEIQVETVPGQTKFTVFLPL